MMSIMKQEKLLMQLDTNFKKAQQAFKNQQFNVSADLLNTVQNNVLNANLPNASDVCSQLVDLWSMLSNNNSNYSSADLNDLKGELEDLKDSIDNGEDTLENEN